MKHILLDLIEKEESYDYSDISDELSKYYYDSGSFSNVYCYEKTMLKINFKLNNLMFIKYYLSKDKKICLKLKEMMLSVGYKDKDYDVLDYFYFIYNELKLEGEKLKELSVIDSYPNLLFLNNDYFLMEKMNGKPLYSLSIEDIHFIPKEAWLNLIDDLYKAVILGYLPIDVTENNVLWSKEDNSFYLIDVGLYLKSKPYNLSVPKFLQEEKYQDIMNYLRNFYLFDEDYIELDFNS